MAPMSKQSQSGQSLSEYGLIAASVCLVGILSLTTLGGNLNSVFNGMVPQRSTVEPIAVTSTPAATQAETTTTSAGSNSATEMQLANTPANSARAAAPLDLKVISSELKTTVQTLGANGTAQMLANSLTKSIDQLLADPNLNPEQKNLLSALSNQGHDIAKREQVAQDLFQQYKNNLPGLWNASVTYGDEHYANFTAFTASFGSNIDVGYKSPSLTNLSDLLAQARTAKAFNNPADEQTINRLVAEITTISFLYDDTVTDMKELGDKSIKELDARAQYMLETNPAQVLKEAGVSDIVAPSQLTTQNSVQICTMGGGADSGTSCP
jgi:Flp pilus assembly pilin Flp